MLTNSPRKYIAGPDSEGKLTVATPEGCYMFGRPSDYCMVPFCWVEDRPVYKGDKLYYSDGRSGLAEEACKGFLIFQPIAGFPEARRVESFTWNKPQVKSTLTADDARRIIKDGETYRENNRVFSSPYERDSVEHILFEKGWLHGEH